MTSAQADPAAKLIIKPAIKYGKCRNLTQRRSGVPAAARRNQFFRRRCHAPQPSQGYRRQAATAGGSVRVGPPGLSGSVWSGLAAVRWFVERVVAARRGGHPAPTFPEQELPYLIAGLIRSHLTATVKPDGASDPNHTISPLAGRSNACPVEDRDHRPLRFRKYSRT